MNAFKHLIFILIVLLHFLWNIENRLDTVKGLNKVRLVGNLSDVLYGIVEVKYNGQWMDVSANTWTDKDRSFVCKRIPESGNVYTSKSAVPGSRLKQLGCESDSASLKDCSVEECSNSTCRGAELATVCCHKNQRHGQLVQNNVLYLSDCPMPWNETSGKCYRDYYSLSYEDARHIPTYFLQESNIYWIDSRVKVFPVGNGINYADLRPFVKKKECHNIQITCFDENMMFYGIQGDQCFCIDLTTENITQLKRGVSCNNNENSTTRNTSESCTIIIYHLNTTKDRLDIMDNTSLCIHVQFKDDKKIFKLANCGLRKQFICWKDACHKNPCQNAGICRRSDDIASYICDCTAGFIGQHCDKDACNPSPCKQDETCVANRSNYSCITENKAKKKDSENTRKKTTGITGSESDNNFLIIILVVVSLILSLGIAAILVRRKLRSRKSKGDGERPNSMANNMYGVKISQEEVYDEIDDSKLDPHFTKTSRRGKQDVSVEVIELEAYSTPPDALTHADMYMDEYSSTYDEAKLLAHQVEMERAADKKDIITQNCSNTSSKTSEPKRTNCYHILDKETSCEQLNSSESTCAGSSDVTLMRSTSYEDSDINSDHITRNVTQQSKGDSIDSDYKVSVQTKRIDNQCPENPPIFEGGIDNIPKELQRKLGIKIITSDYSEYYEYKISKSRSQSDRCKNTHLCDKISTVQESSANKIDNAGSELDRLNTDSVKQIDDYDKLCHFVRKETRVPYDHVGFTPDMDCSKSNENWRTLHKRSKSI